MNSIVHLAGEQPLPVYMGVMQFDCPRHFLAVTERTRPVGETVRNLCADAGLDIELFDLDAYDVAASVQTLEKLISGDGGSDWGFNLTGGTKPMFAAAYRVAREREAAPFYIETTCRAVHWLDGSGKREELRPVMNTVEAFVRLAGYSVLRPPDGLPSPLDSPEGLRLLETMWSQRRKLGRWYRHLAHHARYDGVPFKDETRLDGLPVAAELKGPSEGYAGSLRVGSETVALSPWPTLAKFACGGWMEDFLFSKARLLLQDGSVTDLRGNLLVSTSDHANDKSDPFQEFDLAFTDGYCLSIGECKAGDIDQGHIQKLENLARRFGGHFGKGVLIAGRPDRLAGIRERIEKSTAVCAVSAEAMVRDPALLLKCKPGNVVLR